MKLLFVEDDSEALEPLIELLEEEKLVEQKHLVKNFNKAIERIKDIRPDVVILDIVEGDLPSGEKEGLESLEFIWNEHFCPVIVYSAVAEAIEHKNHHFVHYIKKGSGSPEKVLEKLKEIEPHINTLRSVEKYLYETFSSVLKEVAPYAVATYEENLLEDALKRATKRRLAAQMDEPSNEKDELLAPWEQYIFPPISEEFRLGDVLKEKTSDSNDPRAFRIVLTPSCDLERRNGEPKVENVLVGQCCPIEEGIKKSAYTLAGTEKKRESDEKKMKTLLSQGHSNAIIPLPILQDLIPLMAADLRDLELIPVDKIGISDSSGMVEYIRVASLDSPFREMVAWAYIQIAGRPGLPNRNFDKWIEEILKEHAQDKDSE